MPTPITDDEKDMRRIQQALDELEADDALYGHAIDGLTKSIDLGIQEIESDPLEERMQAADDEVAQMAADVLKEDVAELDEFGVALAEDDREEDALLADEE